MRTVLFEARLRDVGRCLFLIVPLMLVGCGTGDLPQLGTVTGRVVLNDEPLKNVEITFSPDNGRPSYGRTNDDGRYELEYLNDTKGAKVGKHTISIRSGKVAELVPQFVEIKSGANQIDIACKLNRGKSSVAEGEE